MTTKTSYQKNAPPIKWAGGKRQLLVQFRPLFPARFNNYLEPFVGGGAVLLYLIDNNRELINFYHVLRDSPRPFV